MDLELRTQVTVSLSQDVIEMLEEFRTKMIRRYEKIVDQHIERNDKTLTVAYQSLLDTFQNADYSLLSERYLVHKSSAEKRNKLDEGSLKDDLHRQETLRSVADLSGDIANKHTTNIPQEKENSQYGKPKYRINPARQRNQ